MTSPKELRKEYRKVVFASVFGTIIEWYDFLIYGTAAALVFNKLFFPALDPLVGTLAALAAYGVGFFGRPLGAVIFGHYGDRIGRKSMLIATMLTMGLATFAVGCLPTYEQIGILAPVALSVTSQSRSLIVSSRPTSSRSFFNQHLPSSVSTDDSNSVGVDWIPAITGPRGIPIISL
jgi:MFS family permease